MTTTDPLAAPDFAASPALMPVEEIAAIPDVRDRANVATRALDAAQQRIHALSDLRVACVRDLRAQGLSHSAVAEALGVSRTQAAAIAKTAAG